MAPSTALTMVRATTVRPDAVIVGPFSAPGSTATEVGSRSLGPADYLADCAEAGEVWPGHVDMIRSASAARRSRLAAISALTVATSLSR